MLNPDPYRRQGHGTAVLFIHGIIGTPRHFDFLLRHVPASWTIENLLLPGHGGSVSDFSRATMQQWSRHVEAVVDALAVSHDRVLIAGHSMGTLLAIESALRRPDKVHGLFLLAVPLKVFPRPAALTNALRVIFGRVTTAEARSTRDACGIRLTKKLWLYIGWIRPYLGLFAKIREIRRRLDGLSVPAVVLQSARDELVLPSSAKLLRGHPAVDLRILPDSRHFHYAAADRAAIESAFAAFCKRIPISTKR